MKKLIFILFIIISVFTQGQHHSMRVLASQECTDTIEFIALESDYTASSTSQSCNVPTGTTENDFMIAFVNINSNLQPINTPSGWIELFNHNGVYLTAVVAVFYRIATDSEPSSYTWDGWSADRSRVTIVTYRNVDIFDPINIYNIDDVLLQTSVTAASVTTDENNNMLLFPLFIDTSLGVSITSPPSGMNERISTGTGNMVLLYDEIIESAGATGTRSATIDASRGIGYSLIALNSSCVTPASPVDWGISIRTYIGDMSILNNRITDSGYIGITFTEGTCMVRNNYIDGACQVLDDGGGIYTYNGSSFEDPGAEFSEVTDNIILNVYGNPDGGTVDFYQSMGIYLDNATHDVLVEGNTVSGATTGFHMNSNGRDTIRNNTFMDCMLLWGGSKESGEDNVFVNNILYTTDRLGHPNYWGANTHQRIEYTAETDSFENNTYVCHYTETDVFANKEDFEEWQLDTGQDENSTYDGTDLTGGDGEILLYNNTKASIDTTLTGTWDYLDGNPVSFPITIQSFESIILTGQ